MPREVCVLSRSSTAHVFAHVSFASGCGGLPTSVGDDLSLDRRSTIASLRYLDSFTAVKDAFVATGGDGGTQHLGALEQLYLDVLVETWVERVQRDYSSDFGS
jgi:hypothetical protein